jgi:hypothetical protein
MKESLVIGVSAWVIQDGNYRDFRRGDRTEFALEFYPQTDSAVSDANDEQAPSRVHLGANVYHCKGRVTYVSSDWWVIDVGVLLYRAQRPPQGVRQGWRFDDEIHIGVDPFFYSQRLSRHHEAPGLIYDWEITKIELLAAPPMEIPQGRAVDPEGPVWREIAATNAWQDNGGRAEYALHCACLNGTPRR